MRITGSPGRPFPGPTRTPCPSSAPRRRGPPTSEKVTHTVAGTVSPSTTTPTGPTTRGTRPASARPVTPTETTDPSVDSFRTVYRRVNTKGPPLLFLGVTVRFL